MLHSLLTCYLISLALAMLSLLVCGKKQSSKASTKNIFVESKLRHDGSKRGSIFEDFTRNKTELAVQSYVADFRVLHYKPKRAGGQKGRGPKLGKFRVKDGRRTRTTRTTRRRVKVTPRVAPHSGRQPKMYMVFELHSISKYT